MVVSAEIESRHSSDLDVEHPDELAIGHRHDRLAGAARERRGPFADVDRWLGHDLGALPEGL
jgi:hypothetical protein